MGWSEWQDQLKRLAPRGLRERFKQQIHVALVELSVTLRFGCSVMKQISKNAGLHSEFNNMTECSEQQAPHPPEKAVGVSFWEMGGAGC